MTQGPPTFQYKCEKDDSVLTGFAGLPLYLELAIKSGLSQYIQAFLKTKTRGWSDQEMVISLILLNLAGGDCITDINRLEQDKGLKTLLSQLATHGMSRQEKRAYLKRWRSERQRGLPSTAAIHRYLRAFHNDKEEGKRVEGKAFIPEANDHLKALIGLNTALITAAQQHTPHTHATLDQDATLTTTHKSTAHYCYKKQKAYQPFNTYWAEHGLIVHSEFRDGNVPAGFEQLRLLKESLSYLPEDVKTVSLRSDSAGYQEALLKYCAEGEDPRFGVIEFTIAARVSASFKDAVGKLKAEDWHPIYHYEADGSTVKTAQEWAEVCFVPSWAGYNKKQANYRYVAIREKMTLPKSGEDIEKLELPFQTIKTDEVNYKLFAVVTNSHLPGSELIHWHRQRCGKSEQVHSIQKNDLAGGQLPSCYFGTNAAWWQIMILSFNLNRLMQIAALPEGLKEKKMKALRFHFINIPGRLVRHARQVWVRVERHAYDLFQRIRNSIACLPPPPPVLNTS